MAEVLRLLRRVDPHARLELDVAGAYRDRPRQIARVERLGDEDGLALCATLRADDSAPEVVIYTADGSADMNRRARAAGACGAVAKERDVGELFDALRLAVRRRAEVDAVS